MREVIELRRQVTDFKGIYWVIRTTDFKIIPDEKEE